MGLLAPWFLAGALAVGLPIYLHLLRRHSTTPQSFSSLMFFEQRTQSSIKHRRLRYLALLALRIAILLLLALAFANPFINRTVASMAGDRLLLLVLDNSFSMRAGTRMADARDEALNVLDSRDPGLQAQIMSLSSQIRVLTQPTQDAVTLRTAVDSIEPEDSRATFSEVARAVRTVAENRNTPVEVHLFSDIQRSGIPAGFAEMALPANVSLIVHPVVNEAVPNWTVESVSAPSEVWNPESARVQAVISGYDTPEASRTVSLVVDGRTIGTHTVDVPAGGRATAEFLSLDVPYGFTRCEVRIDSADALPADDISRFAVQRSDPQGVLFVRASSDSRSPLYFQSALAAAAQTAFSLQVVTSNRLAGIDPARFAFVVLSDVLSLPASFEQSLTRYVQGGGSVLIAAGTSAAGRPPIPVFGGNVIETRYYSRQNERFLTVGDADPSHPSVGRAERWGGVKFYYAVSVEPGDARVVARLTDRTPLLLEKRIGEGHVLLLTSGLDNLTNDFPLHPVFVPFVEQTARYLSGLEQRNGARVVDSFLELRRATEQTINVEVIDPEGQRPLSLAEAGSAQSVQLTREGFYQIRLANGRQDMVGVNADRRESNLDVIPEDVLALWRGDGASEAEATPAAAAGLAPEQETRPYSLWWYVMLLLLTVAIAESLLSSKYLGADREGP